MNLGSDSFMKKVISLSDIGYNYYNLRDCIKDIELNFQHIINEILLLIVVLGDFNPNPPGVGGETAPYLNFMKFGEIFLEFIWN